MSYLDWIVLVGTIGFIVIYGAWKTRKNKGLESFLKGDNQMKWATIGLSVMATQASAITFISTPGQAYDSGMSFVQNYFGLPLALIIVSAVFIPIYYKLKVYTAYEFLESRFGIHSRLLAALLFLVQRGLAAGITIYAPAIILSTALGWNLTATIFLVGGLVIIYTVSGGTRAVSLTQKWQMGIIMLGMFIAFGIILSKLPEYISFGDAVRVAGIGGKLNIINFSFDLDERYTFWTGITGGLFLSLSYFGTDQSQVQRYLGGQSIRDSRMGLMFNALLKIPMQFFILFVGVMVFVFFQFEQPPILFNKTAMEKVNQTAYAGELKELEKKQSVIFEQKNKAIPIVLELYESGSELEIKQATQKIVQLNKESREITDSARDLLAQALPQQSSKESDYVFLTFILNYLPVGLIGLLLAVIFSAAMSSTAGELNALASTTSISGRIADWIMLSIW
ncbi:MAG: sodium:solute symporter [Bacteroidetes bacterium]|nr:sodium:solute symporter [Bacteroidota bacterium]